MNVLLRNVENLTWRTKHRTRNQKANVQKKTLEKKQVDKVKWVKRLHQPSLTPESHEEAMKEKLIQKHAGKSPLEIFSLFFDKTIMDMIVENSVQYARQNNNHSFKLDTAELSKFLAILILSGYHTLPQQDMYWSRSDDCNVELVQIIMTRSRFREIKKYLHVCDNDALDETNRFAKIQPLIDVINKKYLQFGVFSFNLSIDEEMIPYFGRHSAKMCIKSKF